MRNFMVCLAYLPDKTPVGYVGVEEKAMCRWNRDQLAALEDSQTWKTDSQLLY